MKRLFLILFGLLAVGPSMSQNGNFFVASKFVGAGDTRQIAGAVTYFVTQFSDRLHEKFPCTKVLSNADVASLIGHERNRELLGSGSENGLSDIAGAMYCEFLLNLEVGFLPGGDFILAASCIPMRTKFPMFHLEKHGAFTANGGNLVLAACDELAKKVVDKFKTYELCPFKGPIDVEVKTEMKDKRTESHPATCHGNDGIYKLDQDIYKQSTAKWHFEKIWKCAAQGDCTYQSFEESVLEEQNDCYACGSGREGSHTYHEKVTTTVDIKNLSREATYKGQKVQDALAELKFNEDGTYTLSVMGTSQRGPQKTRTTTMAEGTCDNAPSKTDEKTKQTETLIFEVFGPFAGTAFDPVLTQQQTITHEDPASKEKTTITFSFNLKK
jgi:hypothetical protein